MILVTGISTLVCEILLCEPTQRIQRRRISSQYKTSKRLAPGVLGKLLVGTGERRGRVEGGGSNGNLPLQSPCAADSRALEALGGNKWKRKPQDLSLQRSVPLTSVLATLFKTH